MSDGLLPLPVSAVRYRRDWLPTADWVELDEVGHAPQLDVPLEAAQLISTSPLAEAGDRARPARLSITAPHSTGLSGGCDELRGL